MRTWTCQACGATGQQANPHGPLRKWCSERCRKTKYDLSCVECGGRVCGTSPGKMAGEPVCTKCAGDHYAVWTREAIAFRIQEWADDNGGIPPSSQEFMRAKSRGESVPSVTTVQTRFGSWNAAILAAGFEPHATGPVGGYRTLSPSERRECARRYAAGETSVAIASDLNCSPLSVIRWVRDAGVAVRPTFGRRAA